MAQKIGQIVWWSVSEDFRCNPESLVNFDFACRLPRNDYKCSLIKAVKIVRKNISSIAKNIKLKGLHQRFIDNPQQVDIAITLPVTEGDHLVYKQLFTVSANKKTGELSFKYDADTSGVDYESQIITEYTKGKQSIDATQFRNLVSRFINRTCRGVVMRKFSGGVYFVPSKYDDKIASIKNLFNGSNMRFDAIPVYDDPETMDSIEWAVSESFESEIKRFTEELSELSKTEISKKTLESRAEEAGYIKQGIEVYKQFLAKRAEEFGKKAENLITVLEQKLNIVGTKVIEPFDFLSELSKMN